jgi:hypothetical protein
MADRIGAALQKGNMGQPGEFNARPPKYDTKRSHEERREQIPLALAAGRPLARIADKRSFLNLAHGVGECPWLGLFRTD